MNTTANTDVLPTANESGEASNDFRRATLSQHRKRPGPRRDSKPAPSEKLERNRQAQRTHRERKEQYLKDLEQEVMRLKELFVRVTGERDFIALERDRAVLQHQEALKEIQRLRDILQSSALSVSDSTYSDATRANSYTASVTAYSTPAIASGPELAMSHVQAGSHRSELFHDRNSGSSGEDSTNSSNPQLHRPEDVGSIKIEIFADGDDSTPRLDYDEIGLDFVLTLERPCMQHQHFLAVRAHLPEYQTSLDTAMGEKPPEVPDDGKNENISGHVLMATAPSFSDVMKQPEQEHTHAMPDLKRPDLIRLLNMSQNLPFITEQELPPVKAWLRILREDRARKFTRQDFDLLKADLLEKVDCLRFGAIIAEADILSAIDNIVKSKQPDLLQLTDDNNADGDLFSGLS